MNNKHLQIQCAHILEELKVEIRTCNFMVSEVNCFVLL